MKSYQEKIKFRETQSFTLINLTFSVLFIGFIMLYFLTNGYNKIPFAIFLIVIAILIVPILLFYRMKTIVTDRKIIISFGIGIIRITFEKKNLDVSNISTYKIPWYYGVGIRIAKDGVIYNASPGKSVKIAKLNSNKYLYIGTKSDTDLTSALLE